VSEEIADMFANLTGVFGIEDGVSGFRRSRRPTTAPRQKVRTREVRDREAKAVRTKYASDPEYREQQKARARARYAAKRSAPR
jgi:hypothetical protein